MLTDMPGTAERRTKAGFAWGDNPDDPEPIMQGWKLYHGL
jgi:hypothetical protein